MTNKELTELKKIEDEINYLVVSNVMEALNEELLTKTTPSQEDIKREASETPVMDFVEWYNHKTLSEDKVEKIIPLRVVEGYLTQQSKEVK